MLHDTWFWVSLSLASIIALAILTIYVAVKREMKRDRKDVEVCLSVRGDRVLMAIDPPIVHRVQLTRDQARTLIRHLTDKIEAIEPEKRPTAWERIQNGE